MRPIVRVLLVNVLLATGVIAPSAYSPAQALEALALYDDFAGMLINPTKWRGSETGGTEVIRRIENGRLRMLYRAYGGTASDSGQGFARLRLDFTNPSAITAIKATVNVTTFEAGGCVSNPDAAFIRARLLGWFFSSTSSPPGDSTGSVVGRILVGRFSNSADPPDVLRVRAGAFECLDANCDTTTELLTFLDLGPVTKGRAVTLVLQWDQDNHRFIFRRDGKTVAATYTVADTFPPAFQVKRLDVTLDTPNCTLSPRPVGSMDVLFDDVFVNVSGAVVPLSVPRTQLSGPDK